MSSIMSTNIRDKKRRKTEARTPPSTGSSGASKEDLSSPPSADRPAWLPPPKDSLASGVRTPQYPLSGSEDLNPPLTPGCSDPPSPGEGASRPGTGEVLRPERPQDLGITPPPCFFCYKVWKQTWDRVAGWVPEPYSPYIETKLCNQFGEGVLKHSFCDLTPIVHFTLGRVFLCNVCGCALPAPEAQAGALSDGGAVTRPLPRAETPVVLEPRYDLSESFARLLVAELQLSPDVRMIVLPQQSGTRLDGRSGSYSDQEPLQNLKMIRQTSERTHFDLDLDSRRGCRFYYDVGSDDLIALNEGKESIWLVALNVGAATGPNQTVCLDPGEKNPISPGYWGMMAFLEEDESGPVMAECLLLPRRWTFQQFPVPLAGLVTPGESPADDVAWTTQVCL